MTTNSNLNATSETATRNKEVVRRWFDAVERGAIDELQACWTPSGVNHASGRPGLRLPAGRASIGLVARALRTAFPDRHWQIDAMLAEADLVACRMTISGTFGTRPDPLPLPVPPGTPGVEGTDLIGADASGKSYSVKHMHMFRVVEGLIAEHWAARDDLGLLLQLGAIPLPAQATTEQ